MTLLFLDSESMGLDAFKHGLWEAAWAEEEGEIYSTLLSHSPLPYEDIALKINHYAERFVDFDFQEAANAEDTLYRQLRGATVVGANPAFDTLRLSLRWGMERPWHYRSLDIEAYAMPRFDYALPQGLNRICADLRKIGWQIPEPDHTAAGDVAALREAFFALRNEYRERI